ncbi:MAG: cell division protein FtsZ [Paracoccaceae bacterium]
MTLNLKIPEKKELKPRIIVFGIGGAGGNAVNNMISKNLEGIDFIAGNTDAQALQQSGAAKKIQLGERVTEGLGAGAKPEIGTLAAEESLDQITDVLEGGHMCFITAGMGGGTGTGAAPIIANAARSLGILTIGVVTKPFQFEGIKRQKQAEEGIEALQKVVDTLIVIPNQNLFRLANEKTTFTEAFSMADDVLYQGVKGVTDLMVRPGLINLDFADVRSVMDEMGKAMMGTGEASGEDRAIQAAEKAIANPLLDEISLKGAMGVLINITGGNDMTLFELDEAANRIKDEVDPEANIIIGSTLDTEVEGSLRVSVVATGIDAILTDKVGRDLGKVNTADNSKTFSQVTEGFDDKRTVVDNNVSHLAEQENNDCVLVDSLSEMAKDLEREKNESQPNLERTKENDGKVEETLKSGEPTVAALERLEKAVNKEPDPDLFNRPKPKNTDLDGYEKEKTNYNPLNSLIRRMTGAKDKVSHLEKAINPVETFKVREDSRNEEGSLDNDISEDEDRQSEIPAFLRRQAN